MSFYAVVQTETFKQPKVSCYPRSNGISPHERCSAVRQMTNAYGDLASSGFVVARDRVRAGLGHLRGADIPKANLQAHRRARPVDRMLH